ncbi:MAG: glutathione S-transferase family protein, partial [Beijerinckiaceae bacterium]
MTLKLFYSPGACSLASHIALHETGAPFEAVRVNLMAGEQRQPDYLKMNPKGRVPVLADAEFIVTENPAILYYISQKFPDAGLWPRDLQARAACLEWCAFMSSAVHVSYAHIRRAERYATGDEAIANVQAKGKVTTRETWEMVERKLASGLGPWAVGKSYSLADPYLLVFWHWGRGQVLGYDMAKDFPAWTAH